MITVLRLPFIIGIILFHTHAYFGDPCSSLLGSVYRQGGSLGNIFFYMSSGFLMSLHYRNRIAEQKISLSSFLLNRLLSIYPLFFVSNLVQLCLIYSSGGLPDWPLSKSFLSMLLVSEGWVSSIEPPNFPTWFISLLVLCYLLFFIICHFTKTRNSYRIVIILLILWGYYLRGNPLNFPFCYAVTGSAEMYFFEGCLISELLFSSKEVRKVYSVFSFTCFFILILFSLINGFTAAAGDTGLIYSVTLMPCIFIIASRDNLFTAICSKRVLLSICSLSMHLFFWHIPVFTLMKRIQEKTNIHHTLSGWQNMLLYLAALIAASVISKVVSALISKKCQKVKTLVNSF